MGLDANYPAMRINDPAARGHGVEQDHVPIGTLGLLTGVHSAATNVKCISRAWDDAFVVPGDEPGQPWPVYPRVGMSPRRRHTC